MTKYGVEHLALVQVDCTTSSPSDLKPPAHAVQQCAVDPRTRVECGLFKLNQILCHLRGCCYREITPDVHKCYKAEVPPICEVPAHERTTCGYPFISVDACNQEGCCFDARLWPSEWCFRPSSSSR
ncbi:putative gastrointestinal growth factor xP4 isoform X1 [Polypterus senegalus]|uniref:putative gastrointestinal growth factor xP4 isoform X1 n=1 Tax=Polypterus senegalus TaxID=55291 RepID=UPI00196502F5|nr:putative gastrointestinal growth factor xP4 isoform X1 [Polypterus senegalus]